uniref:Uncharacterized protein n=1 Tax=Escherichia coli TaxID=562 RepID=A0A2R4ACE8_ECOLX|nr:hypothetical protein p301-4_00129 [Escherichia coli]AVR63311.1 hypothetical protein p531-3_00123 [Escherichia coli]
MRNCNVCSSVKAQKNFVQKPNGRYRKHRSESAHFRKKWRKRWVSNMTRYCHPPCASLQPVNRYRPHFPVKPGLSGRKRNAVLPVVVNSVLWDVMCQSNWSLSAAPLRLSKHNVRNWPVAGATISCRHQYLQNPLHAVMPERGSWPMSSPENMQTICRYTASQRYTAVRVWS